MSSSPRRSASNWLLALFAATLLLSAMGAGQGLAAASRESGLDAARAAMQITLLPTFIFSTATRTPTPINLGNLVWDDVDHDGRQDAGEPGLAGVTVQLWNSAKTALLGSTTTSASGTYTLVAPTPGDYRIRVLLPGAGDSFSPKDQAGGDNTLDSDINPTGADFGFTDIFNIASNVISMTHLDAGVIVFRTPTPTRTPTPINLGNFVWHDLNADGEQDAGEPGVAWVTVQLWNSTKTQLLGSTTTNANGNYTLVAPLPGDYRIRVLLPAGASFTAKDQAGVSDTADSDFNPTGLNVGFTDIFNIASNVISITSFDAGLLNVVPVTATFTPTPTRTATATLTPSPTPSPTPPPGEDPAAQALYLPALSR